MAPGPQRSRIHLRRSPRRALLWGAAGGLAFGAVVAAAALVGLADSKAVIPVALVVFAIVASAKYATDTITASIVRQQVVTARQMSAFQAKTERRIRELQLWLPASAAAAASFSNLPYPLPLDGRWQLAWDVAGLLAREVFLARPTAVVELGSGGSSLVIGEQLRRLGGGHLYTLDHEPAYASNTRRLVESLGLGAWVTVLDAPLVEQEVHGARYRWYDLPREVRDLAEIDALVVDGPPQSIDHEGTPRYPALPVLIGRLSATAFVLVDDASRDAEKRMLQRWIAEEPGWALEVIPTSKGTALLRRGRAAPGSTIEPAADADEPTAAAEPTADAGPTAAAEPTVAAEPTADAGPTAAAGSPGDA